MAELHAVDSAGVPEKPLRLDDAAVEQRLAAIDGLLEQVEQFPGPTSEAAIEALSTVLEVYGEALARVVDVATPEVRDRLCADQLLRHLMALHDCHPEPVEARVRRALDELRSALESRGRGIELLGIEDGRARVRLTGGGGCGSCVSTDGVDEAVGDSVLALAPELAEVLTEAGEEHPTTTLIPVEALLRPRAAAGTP
jgi:Fe-S cluster biogenesis protein NfuA